jgi:hypothetical protein
MESMSSIRLIDDSEEPQVGLPPVEGQCACTLAMFGVPAIAWLLGSILLVIGMQWIGWPFDLITDALVIGIFVSLANMLSNLPVIFLLSPAQVEKVPVVVLISLAVRAVLVIGSVLVLIEWGFVGRTSGVIATVGWYFTLMAIELSLLTRYLARLFPSSSQRTNNSHLQ